MTTEESASMTPVYQHLDRSPSLESDLEPLYGASTMASRRLRNIMGGIFAIIVSLACISAVVVLGVQFSQEASIAPAPARPLVNVTCGLVAGQVEDDHNVFSFKVGFNIFLLQLIGITVALLATFNQLPAINWIADKRH